MNVERNYARREYNLITTAELRSLLFRIKSFREDVSFRFRRQGELWMPNFLQVITTKHSEALFRDRATGELIYVHDIDEVMQFELDATFEGYQPHNHYDVDPLKLSMSL